jgi:hypothetical protein
MYRRFIFDVLSHKTELISFSRLKYYLMLLLILIAILLLSIFIGYVSVFTYYSVVAKLWLIIFFISLIYLFGGGFTYHWRILSWQNRNRWACWSCLRRRHLICHWLLLVITNFIDIYRCFIALVVCLTFFWDFRLVWNTPYTSLLLSFRDVTSKSRLISCMIVDTLGNTIWNIIV